MVCDNCHERDAVVNLTTIENNAVRQLHLCEQCAAERGAEQQRRRRDAADRVPERHAPRDQIDAVEAVMVEEQGAAVGAVQAERGTPKQDRRAHRQHHQRAVKAPVGEGRVAQDEVTLPERHVREEANQEREEDEDEGRDGCPCKMS